MTVQTYGLHKHNICMCRLGPKEVTCDGGAWASSAEQAVCKALTTVLRGSRSCGRGPVLLVNTSSSTSHEVGSCRWLVQLRRSSGDKHVGSPYALISKRRVGS